MKRLFLVFMFMAFLFLPLSVSADCDDYMTDLAGQCFEVTVDKTDFTLCFGKSVFGPCPAGTVILEYIDTQYIDEVPYETLVSLDFTYYTNPDLVTIADVLDFVLVDSRLILLPEDPLIFKLVEE